jgi:hypothetical protein
MRFTPAYIQDLQRQSREETAPKSPPLRQRVLDWHSSLPEVSRHRGFAMSEIEAALKKPGRYLSPILLELGWERRRRWASKTQYHRYWLPPSRHR